VTAPVLRKALRLPAVLAATGDSRAAFYDKIKRGVYPRGISLDPTGRNVVWFEDVIAAVQQAAVDRLAADSK
jgi:predicted DNA-binding transcriptional regulator AlpA